MLRNFLQTKRISFFVPKELLAHCVGVVVVSGCLGVHHIVIPIYVKFSLLWKLTVLCYNLISSNYNCSSGYNGFQQGIALHVDISRYPRVTLANKKANSSNVKYRSGCDKDRKLVLFLAFSLLCLHFHEVVLL